MFVNMMMLSPATMAPAVSASNSAVTAIIAGAADATKTFVTATATATATSTTTATAATTAAAKTAVRACAAAASAFGAAVSVLWTRCLLALQRLFGLVASKDGTLCTCTCSTAPTAPSANITADSVVTVVTTNTAEKTTVSRGPSALVDLPTESDTASTASTDCAVRMEGLANEAEEEQEGARAEELANEPEEEEEPAQKLVLPRKLANAPEEEEEEPAQEIVFSREVAEHVVSVDDPLIMAVVEELIARHEALGPVPRDTVLQLISYLHAPHSDRASAEGFEDPVAMVDVVLCMLKIRMFDVAATYKRLSTNWPRRVRMAHMRIQVADRATRRRLQKGQLQTRMGAAGVPL